MKDLADFSDDEIFASDDLVKGWRKALNTPLDSVEQSDDDIFDFDDEDEESSTPSFLSGIDDVTEMMVGYRGFSKRRS